MLRVHTMELMLVNDLQHVLIRMSSWNHLECEAKYRRFYSVWVHFYKVPNRHFEKWSVLLNVTLLFTVVDSNWEVFWVENLLVFFNYKIDTEMCSLCAILLCFVLKTYMCILKIVFKYLSPIFKNSGEGK